MQGCRYFKPSANTNNIQNIRISYQVWLGSGYPFFSRIVCSLVWWVNSQRNTPDLSKYPSDSSSSPLLCPKYAFTSLSRWLWKQWIMLSISCKVDMTKHTVIYIHRTTWSIMGWMPEREKRTPELHSTRYLESPVWYVRYCGQDGELTTVLLQRSLNSNRRLEWQINICFITQVYASTLLHRCSRRLKIPCLYQSSRLVCPIHSGNTFCSRISLRISGACRQQLLLLSPTLEHPQLRSLSPLAI